MSEMAKGPSAAVRSLIFLLHKPTFQEMVLQTRRLRGERVRSGLQNDLSLDSFCDPGHFLPSRSTSVFLSRTHHVGWNRGFQSLFHGPPQGSIEVHWEAANGVEPLGQQSGVPASRRGAPGP